MKKLIILAVVISVSISWFFWLSPRARSVRQFDDLENNAKKMITASELQTWATNLLAQHPTSTNFPVAEPGINFPTQLRNLSPRLFQGITISQADALEEGGTPFVALDWGGGVLGHSGFLVGPTNFFWGAGREWQKGVYFIPAH